MKKFKSILSICLIVSMILVPSLPARASEDVIYIESPEDLLAMAKDCRLDTYSLGKTFILSSDITVDASVFKQIPVFRGTFEGSGYTISGFSVKENIAPAGFFGIVEVEGKIKDLTVKGNIIPGGDSDAIGGIAGINRGLIENSSFGGSVTGKAETGGIAGINDFSGIVRNCSVVGNITGQRMSGGIVGNNHGLIDGANNLSLVNVDSQDPTIDLNEIEAGIQSAVVSDSEAEKIYSVIEDAGGIAGFSDGSVMSCINNGDVGYSHIGYNVGGIVGRNQGFIYGSNNYGLINGRREVGGITGQAEPFVSSTPTSDNITSIRSGLHSLQSLVDKATRDIDEASLTASDRLTNINGFISKANDNVKDLSDILTGYVDENLSEINRASEVVKSTADRLDAISSLLPGINSQITDTLNRIKNGMKELKKIGGETDSISREVSLSTEDLNSAINILEEGSSLVREGAKLITESVSVDKEGIKEDIKDTVENKETQINDTKTFEKQISDEIKEGIGDEIKDEIKDSVTIDKDKIPEVDWDKVDKGVELISRGLDILEKGNEKEGNKGVYFYLKSAANHLKDATAALKNISDDVDTSLNYFEEATGILENASKDFTDVLEEVSSLAEFLSNAEPLKFSYVKTKTETASNDLHNNLANLDRELENLNLETRSTSDIFMEDLRAINDQFFAVMDLLINEIDEFKNTSFDDKIEDVSDEDINNSTDGKLQFCFNYGNVFGDINVGGIAGSMGIFNEQNPEESGATINEVLRARYKLKAILKDCSNYGKITSKKDYVGAVCGVAFLGVITDCKGYGSAISEDGDYAGGISGANSTTIRNSYAKCSISGGKYVGGIVGLNSTGDNGAGSIKNCVSSIDILSHKQYAGAICGYDEGIISGNYFFGDYTGINNASYSGKAEPIDFEGLISLENIPVEFTRFKVSFIANEKIIKETYLDYLGSLKGEDFPDVPPTPGQYGKWDTENIENIDFDKEVSAEYFPFVTALSTGTETEEEPGTFLAIGKFSDTSEIKAQKETDNQVKSLVLPGEIFSVITPKEVWEITVNDLVNDNVSLRYYKGETKADSLCFYKKSGESWEKLNAKEIGTYIQIEIPTGTNVIAVANKASYTMVVIIIGALLVVLLVVFVIITKKRKRAQKSGSVENNK